MIGRITLVIFNQIYLHRIGKAFLLQVRQVSILKEHLLLLVFCNPYTHIKNKYTLCWNY